MRSIWQSIREAAGMAGASLWLAVLGFHRSDNLTYAASIAYYALLSMFPFAMLAFAILGSITADEHDRALVLAFVLRYFPSQFDFITVQLDGFRASPLTFGVVGTLALLWGALGFFGAVSTAVNYAWKVEKPRSYLRHKWFSFVMFLVAGGLLVAALLLVSASQIIGATWFAAVLERFPGLAVLRSMAIRNAPTLLFIVVVALVFSYVPNTKVRMRDVWVGAFLTGVLWRLALTGLALYIRDMDRFTVVNGSTAAVVVFLVWVYVQAVILLYGVEFTAAYARLRRAAAARRHPSRQQATA
jgi:membrane protein